MKRTTIITLLVCIGIAPAVFGQDDVSDPIEDDIARLETLIGLDGVSILVEEPSQDFFDRGMTRNLIEANVELALRQADIPVLNKGDQGSWDGNPVLYVAITGSFDEVMEQVFYGIQIELTQSVRLDRDDSIVDIDATTWRLHATGAGDRDWRTQLLEDVGAYTTRFVADYWMANGGEGR